MENSKNITLNLNNSDAIKSMKKRIQELEGIVAKLQYVVFNRQNESTPHLPEEIQIFVLTIDEERISLQVKITDTISDVKRKIYEKIGTPVEMQELLFYRKTLEDGAATLSNCNITNGCTFHLVLKFDILWDITKF